MVMALNVFFYPKNSPNIENSQFITHNMKQITHCIILTNKILTPGKLKQENVWYFCSRRWLFKKKSKCQNSCRWIICGSTDQWIVVALELSHFLCLEFTWMTSKSAHSLFKALVTWCWFGPVSVISGLLHPAAVSSSSTTTTKSTVIKPEQSTKTTMTQDIFQTLQITRA